MLRMPKPLRALEPRMEMPRSRGPLPCLKETPGLSCSRSWTVKAGSFLMRSPLTVVMVCPGGCGSEPGPGCEADVADGSGAAAGGGKLTVGGARRGAGAGRGAGGAGAGVGPWTVGAPRRGAETGRGPGAAATRLATAGLGVVGFTRTSGTATEPSGRAKGAPASGAAGAGADGPPSGFGASVVAGGGEDSCVCPGSGTSTTTAQAAATNQKRRQDNMARSESTHEKDEQVIATDITPSGASSRSIA